MSLQPEENHSMAQRNNQVNHNHCLLQASAKATPNVKIHFLTVVGAKVTGLSTLALCAVHILLCSHAIHELA